MVDHRAIVELWKRGNAVALATLVRVEGSSYRNVGARMLIAENGEYAGSISGGCLEAEIVRKARWKVSRGAAVDCYSMLLDDTADIPYGLGCGGTVDVLLEPANTAEFAAMMAAIEASLRGNARRVVTQVPNDGKMLRRVVLDCSGYTIFSSDLAEICGSREESENAFDEWLNPPQRLLIFGAGDDAKPMVQMAALLGWNAIVIDGRAQWARPERFPEAERVIVATSPDRIDVLSNDAIVLMTHSYEQDRMWLAAVLPARPRYLGLLGSRQRSALLVSEVALSLGWPVERACEHLFAPVGLDLGGDGAEAIALATIAEMQACCEGKLAHSRRMTAELIFEQIANGGASRYLRAQCAL
jgi:xanthine/CO dehydrogenase XdhC/CoxF family maturation factor